MSNHRTYFDAAAKFQSPVILSKAINLSLCRAVAERGRERAFALLRATYRRMTATRGQHAMRNTGGFTLIEMLVVIIIIGILMALLLPALSKAKASGRVSIALVEMKGIESAIYNYFGEYGKLPVPDSEQSLATAPANHLTYGKVSSCWNTTYQQSDIINTLRAIPTGANANPLPHALNPKRIVFLETPARKNALAADGYFLDPWYDGGKRPCNLYYIRLDSDRCNSTYWNGSWVDKIVIVDSFGPDGVITNKDDITSFGN